MTTAPVVQTLTPFRHGASWARVLGILGSTVPACAVAIGIGLDDGHVVPGLILTALVVLTGVAVVVLVLRSRIELDAGGVRRRRRIAGRSVRTGGVAKAVFRRIQGRDEVTWQRNLFLLDGNGRALLRMSDRWWTEEQMLRVAAHVAAPVESTDEPVQIAELRRTVPAQLRWQERHPGIWMVAKAGIVAGASLLIAALATAAL